MNPIGISEQPTISREQFKSVSDATVIIKDVYTALDKITYSKDLTTLGKEVTRLVETATGVFQHIVNLQDSDFKGGVYKKFGVEFGSLPTTDNLLEYVDVLSNRFQDVLQKVQTVAKKRGLFARVIDYLSGFKKNSPLNGAEQVSRACASFFAQVQEVWARQDLGLEKGAATKSLEELENRIGFHVNTSENTELLERSIYQMHFDRVPLGFREKIILGRLEGSSRKRELIRMEAMIPDDKEGGHGPLKSSIHDAIITETKIDGLLDQIKDMGRYKTSGQDVNEGGRTMRRDEIIPGISAIARDVQQKIKKMELGNIVLIPGGSKVHAVIYEVKMGVDKKYTFSIFNTGVGSEFHKREGKMIEAYTVGDLSLDTVSSLDFFRDVVAMEIQSKSMTPLYRAVKRYLIKVGRGRRILHPPDSRYWYREQKRGVCTHACIEAWLRAAAPDEESFNHLHVRSVGISVDNLRSILTSQHGFTSDNLSDRQVIDQTPSRLEGLKNDYKAKQKSTSFRKRMELRKEYNQKRIRLERVVIMFSKLVEINKGIQRSIASSTHVV